jgi:hypothetical protein
MPIRQIPRRMQRSSQDVSRRMLVRGGRKISLANTLRSFSLILILTPILTLPHSLRASLSSCEGSLQRPFRLPHCGIVVTSQGESKSRGSNGSTPTPRKPGPLSSPLKPDFVWRPNGRWIVYGSICRSQFSSPQTAGHAKNRMWPLFRESGISQRVLGQLADG